MGLTADQSHVIIICGYVTSGLTFVGSFFTIISYLAFKDARNGVSNSFSPLFSLLTHSVSYLFFSSSLSRCSWQLTVSREPHWYSSLPYQTSQQHLLSTYYGTWQYHQQIVCCARFKLQLLCLV
jgi:hypothetical protein